MTQRLVVRAVKEPEKPAGGMKLTSGVESWGGQIFATSVESRFNMTEELAEPGQPSAVSGAF